MKIFDIFGDILVNDKASNVIDKIGQKADGFSSKLLSGIGTAAKWGAGIVAGAGAATTALMGLATNSAGALDRIDKLSQKIGISTDSFQKWEFILSQNGSSIDGLQMGMKSLLLRVDESIKGTGEGAESFRKLGISVKDVNGNVKTQEELFEETVEALQGVSNQTEKARLANVLLGRSGSELMPLLNSQKGSFKELGKEAEKLGLIIGKDTIKSGVSFTDTMDKIKRSLGTIKNEVGASIMPTFEKFINVILDNMPTIKTVVNTVITSVNKALQGFWDLLSPITNSVKSNWKSIANVFLDVSDTILEAIKWVIMAVNNFYKENKDSFDRLFSGITDIVKGFITLFKKGWDLFGEDIIKITKWFTGLIKETFETLVEGLSFIFSGIGKMMNGEFEEGYDDVLTGVEVFRSKLQKGFEWVFEKLFDIFGNAKDTIVEVFPMIWDDVKIYLGELLENIVNWFKKIPEKLKEAGSEVVSGISQGVKDKVDDAVYALEYVGESMLTGFKDFFQIKSPSKVMQEMSWYLGEGIALGLQDKEDDTKKAMENVAENMQEGFEDKTKNIAETAIEVIEKMQSGIEGLRKKINDSGKDTGESLVNGIVEGTENIAQVVEKVEKEITTTTETEKKKRIKMTQDETKDYEKAYEEYYNNIEQQRADDFEKNFETVGKLSGLFGQLGDTIGGKMGSVFSSVSGGLSSIAGIGSGIAQAMAGDWIGAATNIIGNVTNLVGIAGDLFKTLFGGQKSQIQQMQEQWAEALEQMEGVTKEVAEGIGNNFVGLFRNIADSIREIDNQFRATGNGIRSHIDETTKETADNLKSTLKDLSDFVKASSDLMVRTLLAINDSNMSEIEKFQYSIVAITNIVTDVVNEAIAMGEKLTAEAMEDILNFVDKTIEEIQPLIDEFNKMVVSEMDKLGNAIIQALQTKYEQEREMQIKAIEDSINLTNEQKEKELALIEERYANEQKQRDDNFNKTIQDIEDNFLNKKKIYDDELAYRILQINAETDEKSRALLQELNNLTAQQEEAKRLRDEEEKRVKEANLRLAVENAKTSEEKKNAEAELNEFLRTNRIAELQAQIKEINDNAMKEIEIAEQKANEKIEIEKAAAEKEKAEQEKLQNIRNTFAEKKKEKEISAVEEEYNKKLEYLEKEKTAIEQHYEALLDAANLEAEALKLVTAENQDELVALLESYNPKWQDAGQSFGEKLLFGLNSEKQNIASAVSGMMSYLNTAKDINVQLSGLKQQAQAQVDALRVSQAQAQAQANAIKQQQEAAKGVVIGVDSTGKPIYSGQQGQTSNVTVNINNPQTQDLMQNLHEAKAIAQSLV
jgi:phage-related protein